MLLTLLRAPCSNSFGVRFINMNNHYSVEGVLMTF